MKIWDKFGTLRVQDKDKDKWNFQVGTVKGPPQGFERQTLDPPLLKSVFTPSPAPYSISTALPYNTGLAARPGCYRLEILSKLKLVRVERADSDVR